MNKTLSAVEIAVEQALSVLKHAPAALVTDVDGTISSIVSRPEDATVSDAIKASLERLTRHLALVAVITAREERVARLMVGVKGLTYVGNYAVKSKRAGAGESSSLHDLIGIVRPLLAAMPCVMLEEKGIAFSLHYRNCMESGIRERLIALVEPLALTADAKLVEGKQVIEIVPARLPDKGSALADLLDATAVCSTVYLGDDLSDIPAFGEIVRRRREGRLQALAIAVVDSEAPAALRAAGDIELSGVDQVSQFFERLADAIQAGEG
jgi:trehalose 6-phosphate phosphatase